MVTHLGFILKFKREDQLYVKKKYHVKVLLLSSF